MAVTSKGGFTNQLVQVIMSPTQYETDEQEKYEWVYVCREPPAGEKAATKPVPNGLVRAARNLLE